MIFLRSCLFQIYFIFTSFFISSFFLPYLFLAKKVDFIGKIWAKTSYFGLKYICNIEMILEGQENLPPPPYIIASKHQSALETIMFWLILEKPTYILKKELTKIPLYGLYLIKMGMIYIERQKISAALRKLNEDSATKLKENSTIVIFPEGTRNNINQQEIKYKSGITSLYLKVNVPIVPVALNTGYFWPKDSFLKKPGKFTIKILPSILPGMEKNQFEENLKETIETHSANLRSKINFS